MNDMATPVNDFNELEELRQQMDELKNKVNQQGHLNEELIKKTIQGKMKGVHTTLSKLSLGALAIIPLIIINKYTAELSWPLTIFTLLIVAGTVISDYLINRINVAHMGDDMVETANKLIKMKKYRSISRDVSLGIALIWFIWYCYEFFFHNLDEGLFAAWGGVIFCLIGGAIGIYYGLRVFNKLQRTNDEMIDQINELTREH